MKISLGICFLLLTTCLLAQTVTGSFVFDEEERDYRVHLPPDFSTEESLPLVFSLHAYSSNALEQEFYTLMNSVADTAAFIVCYPNGLDEQWNVGFGLNNDTDDVGFINALIDTLHTQYNIDLNRVYSTGMSNGGYMSYTLACELTDRIAAIASVTGSIVPGVQNDCTPSRKIPVMEIHGTSDAVVPYNGDNIALPIEDVVDFWVDWNSCANSPDTVMVPNTNTDDNSTALRINYTDCADGSEVVFYKVINGGHSWPGSLIDIDVTNRDFNASAEIWRFFSRFSLNLPSAVNEAANTAAFLKVRSNPFQDQLQLQLLSSAEYQLRIFDHIGRRVYQGRHPGKSTPTVDVQQWQAGVYIVVWETDKAYGSLQIVKI